MYQVGNTTQVAIAIQEQTNPVVNSNQVSRLNADPTEQVTD